MENEELIKCEVKKVAGPIEGGAAVFLETKEKIFMIFVGLFEASAIINEIQKHQPLRPLTHDLLNNILLGFNIDIKKVIISSIVDNTFCATLVLEQKIGESGEDWAGKKNEVHVDARASDSIIIALKAQKDIWVTREVLEKVEDISEQLEMVERQDRPEKSEWKGTELSSVDIKIPDYLPEDWEMPGQEGKEEASEDDQEQEDDEDTKE